MSTLEEMAQAQKERDKIEAEKLTVKRDNLIRRRAEAIKRMAWVESLIFVRLREAALVVHGDTDVKVDRRGFERLAGDAYDAVVANIKDLEANYDTTETREPIKVVQTEIDKLQPRRPSKGKTKIFINGVAHLTDIEVSYDDVILLGFPRCLPEYRLTNLYTVTYRKAYNTRKPKGSLLRGMIVRVTNGTRFDVALTSKG